MTIGACLVLATTPALTATPASLDAVLACRKLTDDAERLRCYDTVALVPAQPVATKTPEQTFGLSATAVLQDTTNEPELPELQATITKVSTAADGQVTLVLDNGQVWRKVAGSSETRLREGSSVRIRRAALGSFLMVSTTGQTLRVSRVR
jgi:hypothetical protein